MRNVAYIVTALVLALAAGCGGDEEGDPIPAQDAQLLLEQLDGIETQVENGRCGSATFQIRGDGELQDKIAALPDSVDADVRSAIEDGADRLLELVQDECGRDEEPTDTQETETQPTETETQPTETQPPSTETTPTETQPTETTPPPTETTPPPDKGDPPLPAPDQGGGAPAPGAGGARGTR